MSIFEVINICISILVLVVTTLGVGYAGLQLKRTKEIHLENLIWLRKVEAKNALTVRDYDGYLLAKELDYINATQPIPLKYILEKIEKDLKVQNELHKYLNFSNEVYFEDWFLDTYYYSLNEDLIKLYNLLENNKK